MTGSAAPDLLTYLSKFFWLPGKEAVTYWRPTLPIWMWLNSLTAELTPRCINTYTPVSWRCFRNGFFWSWLYRCYMFGFSVLRCTPDPTRRSRVVGGQPQFAWLKERYSRLHCPLSEVSDPENTPQVCSTTMLLWCSNSASAPSLSSLQNHSQDFGLSPGPDFQNKKPCLW